MINISLSTVSKKLGQHQQLGKIITEVKQGFQQVYQEQLINLVLFGSQARGDAKPESDIDILVVLKEKINNDEKHQNIIALISDLCIEYGVLVSCVYVDESQFKQEQSPLLLNIRQEGILL
jgi:predicted nucleotidyltransferase